MMVKNKVLIYSPSSNIWGGGQIYIEQLCNYMNDNGILTYILTSEPETFACNVKKMDKAASKIDRFSSAFKLASVYNKEGFNTIVLNDLASLWLAPVFKLFGFKTISLLHLYLQRKNENELGHSNLEYFILNLAAHFCDNIFSVNKNNQKVFGEDKVEFIGNYVPDWFIEEPHVSEEKEYDFIIVSRLAEQKNIPLFIELIRNLIERTQKPYRALIVGDGPEKDHIHKMVIDEKLSAYVDFLEWADRKDLPYIYDKGKCFVISSHHEGFATTLLEAHARGIPALVTRSAGFCGEFVEGYNDVTGLVFEPEDLNHQSFYKKVATLIDEYDDYKEKCMKKVTIFSEHNVLGPIMQACDQE